MNTPFKQGLSTEQQIEAYLDVLGEQLGAMPPTMQQETREELRQHLQSLVRSQHEPQRIIESALHQFGDPVEIGRRLALEWEEDKWSLSGLTLAQRLDTIRLAGATEADLNDVSPSLKVLNGVQSLAAVMSGVLLMLGARASELHLSPALVMGALYAVLGLYCVAGIIACYQEWQALRRSTAGVTRDKTRALRNLVGRAGVTMQVPCLFLFPHQWTLLCGALLVFAALLHGWGRSASDPRRRLYFRGAMGYGLVMGLVVGTVSQLASHMFGPANWVWLLALPLYYAMGRWFWKRPKSSRV